MNENEEKKPSKALLKLYAEEQNQDQAKKQEAHSQDQ